MAGLADQTGGAAAAAADTAAGKMAIMNLKMDEAQEEIGSAFLPALSALAGDSGLRWPGGPKRTPAIFLAIAGAIAVLAAGILVLNVALSIMAIAEAVALGPILLIVLAVVALIVVIVLIVKHFDTLKAVAVSVWEAIKAAAASVWEALKSGAGAVVEFVVGAWNEIKAAVSRCSIGLANNWPTILAVITGPIGLAVLAVVEELGQNQVGRRNRIRRG